MPKAQRSFCPVACSLDLIGDRWTLLVVRDLFHGKTRFGDFLSSPEHIPTNILAERLKRLETAGLIRSVPYSKRPNRTTRNANDSVFANGGSKSMLALHRNGAGYLGAIAMGVNRG